jgi:hypothetical protein
MRRAGSASPEATSAARTRSRASETALSGKPTMFNAYAMLRKLLKHRVNEQINRQPLTYAFVDFEGGGTRKGAAAMSGPHVHGVMLFEPSTTQKFAEISSSADLSLGMHTVTNIQIDAFKIGRKRSANMIAYAMKSYNNTSHSLSFREELWTMLPAMKIK